jgi:hypothetical protein
MTRSSAGRPFADPRSSSGPRRRVTLARLTVPLLAQTDRLQFQRHRPEPLQAAPALG